MKKITRVKFYNHPVLGDSEINLVEDNERNNSEYISFIIGQNGTGKSKILEAITSFLTSIIRSIKIEGFKWDIDYGIEIDIYCDGVIYKVEYNDHFIFSHFEQKNILDILPDNIIVNVSTFNDKYPFIENEDFYNYCGLRTVSNSIFVNKPSEDCFNNLTEIITNKDKIEVTDRLFNELDLKKKISIIYKKNRGNRITNTSTFNQIKKSFEKSKNLNQKNINDFIITIESTAKAYKLTNYKLRRLINNTDQLKKVLLFLCKEFESKKTYDLSYNWDHNLTDEEKKQNTEFLEKIDIYRNLRDLGVLQFITFQVYRDNYFNFNNVSSGEFNFLNLYTSILSNIKNDSLVIIDEPEVSLHPNWQNMLIYLLNPLLKAFPNAHFMIASHSHLMVSNLHKSSSSIITLKKSINGLSIKNLDKFDTFGWSAEQILFEVFDMVTDRNYYLSIKIQEIIDEMTKSNPNNGRIDILKNQLKKFDYGNLKNEDPLKLIVEKLVK